MKKNIDSTKYDQGLRCCVYCVSLTKTLILQHLVPTTDASWAPIMSGRVMTKVIYIPPTIGRTPPSCSCTIRPRMPIVAARPWLTSIPRLASLVSSSKVSHPKSINTLKCFQPDTDASHFTTHFHEFPTPPKITVGFAGRKAKLKIVVSKP